jgi:uncharacterized membrane protein AbrB (regulator of aidB expression)
MVLRILKLSLGSTVILLFWTFLFSVLIGRWIGIEPVTVVLAFAPGGLAEMSLIALALHAEVAFVSLHHIVRLLLVMLFAAPIFNFLNGLAARRAQPSAATIHPRLKGKVDDEQRTDRS